MRRYGKEITCNPRRIHGGNCEICHPDTGDKKSARRKAKQQIIEEYLDYYENLKKGGDENVRGFGVE